MKRDTVSAWATQTGVSVICPACGKTINIPRPPQGRSCRRCRTLVWLDDFSPETQEAIVTIDVEGGITG